VVILSQPIRLIQRNGKTINLDVTDYQFQVGRGIAAIPIPVLGERFGADLNVVSVKISMNAILRDDDCESTDVLPTKASSYIDFSRPNKRDTNVQSQLYFTDDGGSVDIADIINKPFYLRTNYQQGLGDGSRITFKFINTGGGTTRTGGVVSIDLDLSTNTYAAIITGGATSRAQWVASQLFAELNNTANNIGIVLTSASHTNPSSQRVGHAFTASVVAGMNTTLGNSRIDIIQQEAGGNGDSATPTFWSIITDSSGSENQLAVVEPSFQTFRGGTANTCRSAGDKIQDLIANTANSNVMGAVGQMFQLDTNDEKGALVNTDFNKLDPTSGANDDYIVGIQIPYQSIVQAATADGNNMVARNLLLVTGLGPADSQGSVANVQSASVDFNSLDVYTGIRGTVTGFSFQYSAGDTFYTSKIDFQPIDLIVGL